MHVTASWVRHLFRPILVVACLGAAHPTAAQSIDDVTSTPEAAADLFIRSVRAIRWGTAGQFMAPEALDHFRVTVTMMADADTSGEIPVVEGSTYYIYLVDTDSAGLLELPAEEVFARSIGALIDDMPGLMHALYDRDDEVIGHVSEGPDDAHVVYRTTARLSGAVSEIKVMQLRRGPGGWRVRWSDELEVLDAALRGVGR